MWAPSGFAGERNLDTVCVIGLGYVGLPLLIESAASGYDAIGVDLAPDRVDYINRKKSPIPEFADERLFEMVDRGNLTATCNFGALSAARVVIVCVPTPLGKTKEPDVTSVILVLEEIRRYLKPGQVVVIESTTYPGFTREVALPILEKTGMRVGHDFFLGFSPERIDPGNPIWGLKNTPKVVAGVTPACGREVEAFYRTIVEQVHRVSSTDTAELVKLFENTFRAVNIALANEVALMSNRLQVDTFEVIEAAATKPFGFMPFYPGPGLGGHCIPVDPLYLSWKMKTLNYSVKFIELADALNSSMPDFVVSRAQDVLNDHNRCMRGTKVLVVGVSYKRDVSDVRETPAERILELLAEKGADVRYHDPYVPEFDFPGGSLTSMELVEALKTSELVLIVTDHKSIDYEAICASGVPVFDTRGVTRRLGLCRDSVTVI